MNFRTLQTQDRRLSILKLLAEQPPNAYTSSALIQRGLSQVLLNVSHTAVLADFAHLQEVGAVVVDKACELHMAKITQAGVDAVAGALELPGVNRPAIE